MVKFEAILRFINNFEFNNVGLLLKMWGKMYGWASSTPGTWVYPNAILLSIFNNDNSY